MPTANSTHVMLALSSSVGRGSPWSAVISELARSTPEFRVSCLESESLVTELVVEDGPTGVRVVPFVFDDLAWSPKSERTITAYRGFRESVNYADFRFIGIKLLNRSDLTGTFRFLDREPLLMGAVLSILEMLLREKPELIVFDVTPHEFLHYVLWSVATWLGVRVLFFQPSPVAPTMLARTGLDDAVVVPSATVSASPVKDQIWGVAMDRIGVLIQGADPSYMRAQRQRDGVVAGWRHRLVALRATIGWLFHDRFPESRDFSGHSHRHGFFSRTTKVLLTRSLQQGLRDKANKLGSTNQPVAEYCVFALHYEPERTSLPEGLPIDFQGDALAISREMVPAAVRLIVKEHYSQQSSALRGFAGRSPFFYDVALSLPNTSFSTTDERLSELVKGARCVFTLTGTVAIEAVLRGVPVGYFGSPWWGGLPGSVRLGAGVSFANLVDQTMPSREEILLFLEDLTMNRMIPGLASEPLAVAERRIGPLPPEFVPSTAYSIVGCIRSVLDDS
jgi:hypothetical protein